MSTAGALAFFVVAAISVVAVVVAGRASRGSTARAPWVVLATFVTVVTYVFGALVAYGDDAKDPNLASFGSMAMALLVVVAAIVLFATRAKASPTATRLPVILSLLSIAVGALAVTWTLVGT